MPLYSLLALLAGSLLGYWIQKPFQRIFALDLAILYYTVGVRNFDATYRSVEGAFILTKDIFKIKISNYEYLEAMRTFEPVAKKSIHGNIKYHLSLFRNHKKIVLLIILVFLIIFLPKWQIFMASFALAFILPMIFELVRGFVLKVYLPMVSFNIAQAAYRYTYNRDISKSYKTKAKKQGTYIEPKD